MDLTEKTVSTERIFDGVVVKLKIDTVSLPDGREATREIIEHPGGVCVLAVDENRNVLMVRQFRKPTEKVMFEIPAGKLEVGENPLEAAIRELEEETGVVPEVIKPMGYFYPTPAYCQEKIYMYYAENLKCSKQNLDDGEFLEVEKIPYDSLYDMVMNDEIDDGKTALATLKAKRYLDEKGR